MTEELSVPPAVKFVCDETRMNTVVAQVPPLLVLLTLTPRDLSVHSCNCSLQELLMLLKLGELLPSSQLGRVLTNSATVTSLGWISPIRVISQVNDLPFTRRAEKSSNFVMAVRMSPS